MKIIRGFALFLAVLMVFSCVLLAGCQTNQPQMKYEIASYQGQLAEGQTKSDYNSELFYGNEKRRVAPTPPCWIIPPWTAGIIFMEPKVLCFAIGLEI